MKNTNLVFPACATAAILAFGPVQAATLVDHTFDGVANDIGGLTFQEIDNGANGGGNVNFNTGQINTTGNDTSAPSANVGINTTTSINVGALAPSATGFSITFEVASANFDPSTLAYNGLFFGVTSGNNANGTAGNSLWVNDPYGIGHVRAKVNAPLNTFGQDNFVRQDGEGTDVSSVNTATLGTIPSLASFQDGFTLTLSLFDDETWTLTSTGLSTNLDSNGSLATGTGMRNYDAISSDLTPFVSLQGVHTGTIEVDRITVTAIIPEPSGSVLLGAGGVLMLLGRRRS